MMRALSMMLITILMLMILILTMTLMSFRPSIQEAAGQSEPGPSPETRAHYGTLTYEQTDHDGSLNQDTNRTTRDIGKTTWLPWFPTGTSDQCQQALYMYVGLWSDD